MGQKRNFELMRKHKDTFFMHHAIRVGKYGKPIVVSKFRTMKRDAIKGEKEVYAHGATIDKPSSKGKDPRVTRFGRLLRRTHLDELPQFWAFLRGQLNLVGIRPLQIKEYQELPPKIKKIYKQMGPGLAAIAYACKPYPPTTQQLHHEYRRFYAMWSKSHALAYTVYAWKIFWNKIRGKAPAR